MCASAQLGETCSCRLSGSPPTHGITVSSKIIQRASCRSLICLVAVAVFFKCLAEALVFPGKRKCKVFFKKLFLFFKLAAWAHHLPCRALPGSRGCHPAHKARGCQKPAVAILQLSWGPSRAQQLRLRLTRRWSSRVSPAGSRREEMGLREKQRKVQNKKIPVAVTGIVFPLAVAFCSLCTKDPPLLFFSVVRKLPSLGKAKQTD